MDKRYDFVFLFDVKDGNPNGDPDAGNLPRVDPESGQGLVTDVCLKRKVRNFIGTVKEETPPYEIYVKERAVLNAQHERAYENIDVSDIKKGDKQKMQDAAKAWMCKNFYDIRTFGAVMNTGDDDKKCGQVRGPVQLAFSRSVEPIVSMEHALTVCAARTTTKPIEQQIGIQGRKFTVPYALYRCHGFVNPFLADKTGFSDEDLGLFWTALQQMFELDRSAARGQMSPRKLVVFEHAAKLGNAPAHLLQERVTVSRDEGEGPARCFDDYSVTIDQDNIPEGIAIKELL